MKFNAQQQQIIDHVNQPISTLVVNAGAGTGKTKTLVATLVKMVEEKICDFSQIVAITFTKKAAAEIKQRLNEATAGKYLSQIESSYIGTIDSFCSRLLRENFLYSGIGDAFIVLEPAKQESILISLLDKILMESPPEIIDLIFDIDLQQLKKIVLDVYWQIRATGVSVKKLLQNDLQNYQSFIVEQQQYFKEHYIKPLLSKMQRYCDIEKLRSRIEINCLDKQEWSDLLRITNFNVSSAEKDDLKKIISLLKKKLDILIKLTQVESQNPDQSIKIFQVIALLDQKYTRYKIENKFLDYPDLPEKLISMLKNNSNLQQKYRTKFKKIFVDEFQDTNSQQEIILNLLYNANLFIVGDWKQSIYGFRNADPEIFSKYLHDQKSTVIDLNHNYRSNKKILELVNILSESIFEQQVPLIAGRDDLTDGQVEVLFYRLDEQLKAIRKKDKRYVEADLIAKKILALKDCSSTVILFRKTTSMQIYEEVLNSYGIETMLVSGNDYFLRPEVQIIIDYLKVINNPFDDISLVNTLRSPLFALLDRSLLVLSENKGKKYFYQILQNDYLLEQSEREKLILFWQKLEKYRKLKDLIALPALIELIIEESEYRLYAASQRNGEYILSIVNKLVELSEGFDYAEFLDYVNLLQVKGDDQTIDLGENPQAVQLMTIHKSKGLEFDTVFLADMDLQNVIKIDSLAVDKTIIEKNIAPQVILKDFNGEKQDSLLLEHIRIIKKEREVEEAKRLLYVATTRAIKNLYIIIEQKSSQEFFAPFLRYASHTLSWSKWFNYFKENGLISNFCSEVTVDKLPGRKNQYFNSQKKDLQLLIQAKEKLLTIDSLQDQDFFREITVNQAAQLLTDEQKFLEENYWGEQLFWNESGRKGELIHDLLSSLPRLNEEYLNQQILKQPDCAKYLKGLLASGLPKLVTDKTRIYQELPFILDYQGIKIKGRIDLLIINDHQIEIVDYKTGTHQQVAEFQLSIYYAALKKVYEQADIKLKLIYLPTGETLEVVPQENILEKIRQKLIGEKSIQ